jgi:hypothetical protein
MTGAFIFPIFGALILKAAENSAEINSFPETFGFVLAISTIPFLAFGTYCLDAAVEGAMPKRNYNGSRRQIPDQRKRR